MTGQCDSRWKVHWKARTLAAEVGMSEYESYVQKLEVVRKTAQDDTEYWHARDLQSALGYGRWENFADAVRRAMTACELAGVPAENHFRETTKMVMIGSGGKRATDDWFLSRYACYLIAMNGDSSKEEVAFAQTYFTVQARRQEIQDQLTDVERRRELRDRVKDANRGLTSAAKSAGVVKFAVFHDAGYKGLYGGLGKSEIQARKGIEPKEDLLDCVGHAELAANYFRITQTQQKIERDRVNNQATAINTHREVGAEVRRTMQRISGTTPEKLPRETSLKKLKKVKDQGLLDG
jgi:DNA-damage-inducible protein D